MNNQLTILIPTSPIPTHPSTWILDNTISKLRKFTDAQIIIMADGVHASLKHREPDYRSYISNVHRKINDYGDCRIVIYNDHSHQAIMTWDVLNEIKTPLVMFVEHDTYIDDHHGTIPFQEICDIVNESETFNYIRFNIFHEILDEHKYLMIGDREFISGIPVQKTVQWSQRPHIAKTQWYRDILRTYFKPQDKTMIEDVMHSIVIEAHKLEGKDFGLGIYTPEGNQLRSYHSDGRGSDEKITYG